MGGRCLRSSLSLLRFSPLSFAPRDGGRCMFACSLLCCLCSICPVCGDSCAWMLRVECLFSLRRSLSRLNLAELISAAAAAVAASAATDSETDATRTQMSEPDQERRGRRHQRWTATPTARGVDERQRARGGGVGGERPLRVAAALSAAQPRRLCTQRAQSERAHSRSSNSVSVCAGLVLLGRRAGCSAPPSALRCPRSAPRPRLAEEQWSARQRATTGDRADVAQADTARRCAHSSGQARLPGPRGGFSSAVG